MTATTSNPPSNGVAAGAQAWSQRYADSIDEFADTAGIVNAANARLVDLTVLLLAEGHHVGPGLHTPAQYLCWRAGISRGTAQAIVRIARRVDEIPCAVAALRAGEISLDQTDVIARHTPTRYDESATELARSATVAQLKSILPHYRRPDPEPDDGQPPRPRGFSLTRQDGDTATAHGTLGADQADVVGQALAAMREDLWRQRKKDAEAAGVDPKSVASPTSDEALVAMAETALRAGEAAHPGAERYLINYHLHQGPDGELLLTDGTGHPVAEPERRRLLCDCLGEVVLHGADGTPLSVGRKTRVVGRKLRRAILFRHRGRCAVDGCDTTVGLQIHHIWHWEDGGPTDTWNLIPLCHHHHKAHHQGLLPITGNPELPAGTPGALAITTPDRRPLADQCPAPTPVPGPEAQRTLARLRHELALRRAHRSRRRGAASASQTARAATVGARPGRAHPVASTPTGEPHSRRHVHLHPSAPPSTSPPPSPPPPQGGDRPEAPTPLRT